VEQEQHNGNVIVLDDEASLWQRVIGAVVLLVIVAAFTFPFIQFSEGDARAEIPATTQNRQTVADVCGQWDVPDLLQPVANAAYPSWNWVCQLIEP
jgi:hypothetical protein